MIALKTGQPVTVECIQCFHIENIDTSIMYMEFIRVDQVNGFLPPEPFALESIATTDMTSVLEDLLQEAHSVLTSSCTSDTPS